MLEKINYKKNMMKIVVTLFFGMLMPLSIFANEQVEKEHSVDVVIETRFGDIALELFPDVAPGHVENFLKLAKSGFYDGTTFHRIIPDFMIQGGDPNSKDLDKSRHGAGGPGYSIQAEFNDKPHVRGALSMARSKDPDSAGSQFFIVVKETRYLDHQYTVFGGVISGMDVVDRIVSQARDMRDNPMQRIEMKIRVKEPEDKKAEHKEK